MHKYTTFNSLSANNYLRKNALIYSERFPTFILYSISITSTLSTSTTFCISYTFAYSLQECTLFMEFAMTKPLIPCWLNTLLSLPPKVLMSFGSTSHSPQAATYRLMMDSSVDVSYACMSICCVQSKVAPYFSALFWKVSRYCCAVASAFSDSSF